MGLGETVQALVQKADVSTRAKERGNDLKDRVVGRSRELLDQAVARGIELKDQATAAAEVARGTVGRTPADRWAKLAKLVGAGLMLIACTVIARKVMIR